MRSAQGEGQGLESRAGCAAGGELANVNDACHGFSKQRSILANSGLKVEEEQQQDIMGTASKDKAENAVVLQVAVWREAAGAAVQERRASSPPIQISTKYTILTQNAFDLGQRFQFPRFRRLL
ncbi:hypothetical protein J1614_006255 [Plenodomus biglobosus]|nr:hypothetical protein J1614_006255 [Plenodomus biglobosus]